MVVVTQNSNIVKIIRSKYSNFLFIAFLLFCISCKKKSNDNPSPEPEPVPQKKIKITYEVSSTAAAYQSGGYNNLMFAGAERLLV